MRQELSIGSFVRVLSSGGVFPSSFVAMAIDLALFSIRKCLSSKAKVSKKAKELKIGRRKKIFSLFSVHHLKQAMD